MEDLICHEKSCVSMIEDIPTSLTLLALSTVNQGLCSKAETMGTRSLKQEIKALRVLIIKTDMNF